jgi:transcriptional regulator with XRE-family HTH domain
MEDFKIIIGENLKNLRKKRGTKITEVIAYLGIGRSTYTDWELGRRSPNGEKLVMLAKFYNTTVDFITGKTKNDSPLNSDDLKEIIKNSKLTWNGNEIEDEKQAAIAAMLTTYFQNLNQK